MPINRKRRARQSGNALMEAGFILPVFITIIVGVMDYCNMIYAQNFCTYAAGQAAYYAAVNGKAATNGVVSSNSQITTYVQGIATGLPNASSLNTSTSWSDSTQKVGSTVTVTVTYTFQPMTGFAFGNNVNIASTSTMTINCCST